MAQFVAGGKSGRRPVATGRKSTPVGGVIEGSCQRNRVQRNERTVMLPTSQQQVSVVPSMVKEPIQNPAPRVPWRTLLHVPVAALLALAVHLFIPNNELANEA